jgi:hypothetical protein
MENEVFAVWENVLKELKLKLLLPHPQEAGIAVCSPPSIHVK